MRRSSQAHSSPRLHATPDARRLTRSKAGARRETIEWVVGPHRVPIEQQQMISVEGEVRRIDVVVAQHQGPIARWHPFGTDSLDRFSDKCREGSAVAERLPRLAEKPLR